MKTIKIALLVGALAIASSSAFAQTIAPNVGANLGSHNYYSYPRGSGLNSYDSAGPTRITVRARPRSHLTESPEWLSRARAMGKGYVTGGGVSLR